MVAFSLASKRLSVVSASSASFTVDITSLKICFKRIDGFLFLDGGFKNGVDAVHLRMRAIDQLFCLSPKLSLGDFNFRPWALRAALTALARVSEILLYFRMNGNFRFSLGNLFHGEIVGDLGCLEFAKERTARRRHFAPNLRAVFASFISRLLRNLGASDKKNGDR